MLNPFKSQIKPVKLGLAGGILWAVAMFLTTVISIFTGYGDAWLNVMSSIYPGYTISWGGALVGLVYGFIDGFVCLLLLGWLYKKL